MDDRTSAQAARTRAKAPRTRALGTLLLSLTVVGTMGCATHRYDAYGNHYYDTNHTARGAVLGGLAGAGVGRAIAGHQHDEAGYWIGGALGALTGAVIGDAIDRDEARDRYEAHPPPPVYREPRRPHRGHRGYDRHRDRHRDRHHDRYDDWDDDYDDDWGWDDRHSSVKPPVGGDLAGIEDPKVLSLPDEVLFADESATLKKGAKRRLRTVAKALREHPGTVVVVRGHASKQEPKRRALADARAAAVRDYLLSEGVAPSRVTAVGMAARFPVASDGSAEGRQRNRRAELELKTDRGRELAGLW